MKRTKVFLASIILICSVFLSTAGAADYVLTLTPSLKDDIHGSLGDSIGVHVEYGDIFYNVSPIGNYRIMGQGTTPDLSESIKNADIYLEVPGMGNLFLNVMSSINDRDHFEGIIVGGTGSLASFKGTATMDIIDENNILTLHVK